MVTLPGLDQEIRLQVLSVAVFEAGRVFGEVFAGDVPANRFDVLDVVKRPLPQYPALSDNARGISSANLADIRGVTTRETERPRWSESFRVRVSTDTYEQLRREAFEEATSVSHVARRAIQDWLTRKGQEEHDAHDA